MKINKFGKLATFTFIGLLLGGSIMLQVYWLTFALIVAIVKEILWSVIEEIKITK